MSYTWASTPLSCVRLRLRRSALLDEKQWLAAALAAEQELIKQQQQQQGTGAEGRSAAAAAAAAAVAAAEAEAAADEGVDSLDAFMTDVSQQMEQDKVGGTMLCPQFHG